MKSAPNTGRFSMLAGLTDKATSEERRAILHFVTEALDPHGRGASVAEMAEADSLLAAASADYSQQIRMEIARLVAASGNNLKQAAQILALDDIEVARPILHRSTALTESTLLRVVAEKSQEHLLAVSQRRDVSQVISHALVKRGNDAVVSALLENRAADIGPATFDIVARRAQDSVPLQAPMINRPNVPIELLNELYLKVESKLRHAIMQKISVIPAEELEKAFERSRARVSQDYSSYPEDWEKSSRRIAAMEHAGQLKPPVLVTLLREGAPSRTAFKIALSKLTEVDAGLADRVIESRDIDTVALVCRGANVNRAVFVAIAIALDEKGGVARAEEFGALYESVPVQAAQRALRFWKVRAAA